ncbi:hypothetical protein SAMN05421640_3339 [Ekhidna lutea]|uniref:Uncharacterized protein n=1 Tax=Ekhidna lutea TaxID=447679 RepID=A0A239LM14_EKHLU|nr:hypothetical protein [Ekhidna lutea]SNT30942.1 hypothetical protein SAMN05421640_3339 [Ekhidna lutea]
MKFRKLPYYLSVLAAVIVAFHIAGFISAERSPISISAKASVPGYALQNARLYLEEKIHSRSLLHLNEAIHSIEFLRDHADEASRKLISTGLIGLYQVKNEMTDGRFDRKKLNESSVIVLNALIYYEIASARAFILEEKRPETMKALDKAIENLRNALDFAEGNRKEYEVQIFSDMNTITSNYYADKEVMVQTLDNILLELSDLDVSYSQ